MTPRDELRASVRELIAREGLDPAAADTLTGRIMGLLPSLPVGGGDGRYVADETESGDAIVLDTSADPSPVIAVCPRGGYDARRVAAALDRLPQADQALALLADADDVLRGLTERPPGDYPLSREQLDHAVADAVNRIAAFHEAPASSSAGDEADRNERDGKGAIGTAGDEARDAGGIPLRTAIDHLVLAARDGADEGSARMIELRRTVENAIVSLSSPLQGAGDAKQQWCIVDKDGEPVCTSLGPDDHVLRAERWDEWMPERAPHRLRGRTVTTSAWFDAPAPADEETTR